MKVDVGLLLPSREVLLWRGGDVRFLVDEAIKAERAGYDSVWVGDSLLARPRGEPLTILSAIAAVTNRVRLGTAVLLPLLRRPVQLAHVLATLDRVSNGRLVIGVGPAADVPGTRVELAAVDMPGDHRVSGLLASVERCKRIWRNEEAGIHLEPEPSTPGGPPIWLAAHGPRMLRETGAKFDGWLPLLPTAADYASALSVVREASAEAGRDPSEVTPAVYLTVAVAGSAREAEEQYDAYIRGYYGVPGEVMARTQASHMGTLESAAEWMAGYIDAGARHVVVRLARTSLDGYTEKAIELLGAARSAAKTTPI